MEDPTRLLLYFILPLYVLISVSLLGDQKAIERVYFTSFYALAGGLFLVVLTVASYAGDSLAPLAPRPRAEMPVHILDALFWLALIGYLVMMGGVIARPAVLISFLTGSASTYDVLELKGRIAGISTLTQAGVAYVPLYFYIFRQRCAA